MGWINSDIKILKPLPLLFKRSFGFLGFLVGGRGVPDILKKQVVLVRSTSHRSQDVVWAKAGQHERR